METFSALLAICAGNSPVPVNSPHKGQWRGALIFFICVWINGWVNNRKAGDFKPYRAHYDVTVMIIYPLNCFWETYKYVCIFYHYIHWDGVVAILPDGRHGPLILLNKHHGRWWPDDRRSQSNTSYCIALVFPEYPGLRIIMVNTLRPRQNGRHFPNSIFKCIFLNQNAWISINISLNFVPQDPNDNIPALVQIMAWCRPGDKPLSEPMMVSLLTHICVTRPRWVHFKCLKIGHPHGWRCPSCPRTSGVFLQSGFRI